MTLGLFGCFENFNFMYQNGSTQILAAYAGDKAFNKIMITNTEIIQEAQSQTVNVFLT